VSSTQKSGLNPEQQDAVTWGDGPMMVLAGAGTGKTRVLVNRIAHLVQSGAPAWTILAVTFTNKAAKEMRDRLRDILGPAANEMSIGTFHATSARLLRAWGAYVEVRKGFAIFDDDDQLRLVDRILKDLGLGEQVSPRTLLSLFDRAKNRGEDPVRASAHHFFADVVEKVYPRYRDQLHKENAVDFNDLLLKALELTRHPDIGPRVRTRYAHILVDEFQDTNRVQYDLVCGLAATRNLMVVGDDDQSIYGWRGAEPKNLLDFDRDFPDAKIIKLEQNYRSTQVVLDAANAVIAKNRDRRGKELWTEKTGGDLIEAYFAGDERGEAYFIARKIREMIDEGPLSASDFAVLYRTNAQSRVLEEHMRAMRVPARVVGAMSFYERKEVKDAIAYLRLLVNPSADSAFERIVNVPARGIGDTTVERLRKAAIELAGGRDGDALDEEAAPEAKASPPRGSGTLFSQLLDAAAAKRQGAAPAEGAIAAAGAVAATNGATYGATTTSGDGAAGAGAPPAPAAPEASLGPSLLDMCRAAGRGEVAGIATAARKKLAGFADLIDGLGEVMAAGASVAEILIQIVERSGLREKLEKEDSPESRDRLTNLAELVSTASDFDDETGERASVEDFLERIALSSNSDQSASPDQVTLTTIHVAKGLEFPVVFLSGWEDGLFPSLREREGQDEDLALEEERRLAYVALTRAKQKLVLTMARTRRVWGEIRMQSPSRFFDDIPEHCSLAPRARKSEGQQRDYASELRAMNGVGAGGVAAGRAGRAAKPRRSYDEFDQRTHDDREPVFQVESYDQEASAGPTSGSKVNHAAFGVGRVVDTSGAGRDLKVTVEFPSVGVKTVLARYLLRD
jgi:DNA helicase II / ATP-dependent DNA helicase PcrA